MLQYPRRRYREPRISEIRAERGCPHTYGAELSEGGTGALDGELPPTSHPTPNLLRRGVGGRWSRARERRGAPLCSRPATPGTGSRVCAPRDRTGSGLAPGRVRPARRAGLESGCGLERFGAALPTHWSWRKELSSFLVK